jgi:hypothetical protein
VLLSVSGCAERPTGYSATAGQPAVLVLPGVSGPELLRCDALPRDSVSVTIGPMGGMIVVGPHTLTVPEGALDGSVTITAVAPSDSVRRVTFAPDGLAFAAAVELRLSYAGCDSAASLLPKRVVQVADDLAILDVLSSLDAPSLLTTSASLRHFSGYAVAW